MFQQNPDFASYTVGKTLAEEAAWEFVKKHNLNMVAINPTYVIGPTVLPVVNSTNELPLGILNGRFYSQSIPSLTQIFSPVMVQVT